jgi:hypothetical protein
LVGRSTGSLERTLDKGDEVRREHLSHRQVDGHAERWGGRQPLDELEARTFEDPGADGDDETRVLGQRYEVVWADEVSIGMLPAEQGLDAGECSCGEVDDGLVVEPELLPFERVVASGHT